MKKLIKIKFQNGLSFESAVPEILGELMNDYNFVNSDSPDFIVFGPYGNDVPAPGNYVRIGYFCESMIPDLSVCEWAFGIPYEQEINHPKYKRIQWHGLNPQSLIKDINVEEVFEQKTKFCNFLYSNPVAYRQEFFKQLSIYKHVDAPGRSMNNMPSIDSLYSGTKWEIKRQFLTPYKFTIAFENYSYPGYQTEKLYDAMQMNSIPIYCGDPLIGKVFNTKSFINAFDYIHTNNGSLTNLLEKYSQYTFKDWLPSTYTSLHYKVRRKLKAIGRGVKMKLQLNDLNFRPLIEKIIELDQNPELYMAMLKEPWFVDNKPPANTLGRQRWIEVFNSRK